MGKWYSHYILNLHKKDLEVNRDDLAMFYPHVIGVANRYTRNQMSIGTLDLNDLIQAGHEGLIKAWAKVDWDRIENSPNPQGELWSFIKKRIKWSIQREIDKHADHIATPINKLEDSRIKLEHSMNTLTRTLVNIFPRFFDGIARDMYQTGDSWRSLMLEGIIEDYLIDNVKNKRDIAILFDLYGIGVDKITTKKASKKYDLSEIAVKKIRAKIIKIMRNKEFEKIIENFYEK